MAVYALHSDIPNFLFIINYKVMFSSFSKMLTAYFPQVKFYYKNQITGLQLKKYSKYSIVRNPYNRVVSTFYDKCQETPKLRMNQNEAELQYCQEQLLMSLQLIRGQEYEVVQPAIQYASESDPEMRTILDENFSLLTSMSFGEYVSCVDLILRKEQPDAHFVPQLKAFYLEQRGFWNTNINLLKKTRIIKLENLGQHWNEICYQLGKDIPLIKENVSSQSKPENREVYTKETQKIIAKLYNQDFKRFNYSKGL